MNPDRRANGRRCRHCAIPLWYRLAVWIDTTGRGECRRSPDGTHEVSP